MSKSSNSQFDDKKLHTVDKDQTNLLDDRTPFNDVIKHGDLVQGSQSPKRINQFPKWYQNPRRIYAVITVLVFTLFLIFELIKVLIAILAER